MPEEATIDLEEVNAPKGIDESLGIDEALGIDAEPEVSDDALQAKVDELREGVDAPEPATKVETKVETKEEEAPEIPAVLLARGGELGLTSDEMIALGKDGVEVLATKFDQAVLAKFRSEEPKEEVSEKEDPEAPGTGDFELVIDEYMDEDLANNLKGMKGHYDKKIEALTKQNEQLLQWAQSQQDAEFFGKAENFIAGLGEEYHETFGVGESDRSDPSSPTGKNYEKFWQTAVQLSQVMPGLSYDDLFSRAIGAEFSDLQSKVSKSEVTNAIKKRVAKSKGRKTARPSRKQSSPDTADPDTAAQKFISDFMGERGVKMGPPADVGPLFD